MSKSREDVEVGDTSRSERPHQRWALKAELSPTALDTQSSVVTEEGRVGEGKEATHRVKTHCFFCQLISSVESAPHRLHLNSLPPHLGGPPPLLWKAAAAGQSTSN